MKKKSVFFIGIVVVVISSLSEMALSVIEEEKWSNYVHYWETKWTTPVKCKASKKVYVKKSELLNKQKLKYASAYDPQVQ